MFNELMEYHDYTDMTLVDFENSWGTISLSTDTDATAIHDLPKKKAFKGLERVLTIIARYRLFDAYRYNEFETEEISSLGLTQSETIELVKSDLMAWCGFMEEENGNTFEARGWFKHYYDNVANYPVQINDKGVGTKLSSIKKGSKPVRLKPEIFLPTEKPSKNHLTSIEAILRSDAKLIYSWDQIVTLKSGGFRKKIFTSPPTDQNTFKALNFEKVIASAINLGKLNTFYLLVKDGFAGELKIQKTDSNKVTYFNSVDPVKDMKKLHILLKYIGVYLIEKRYTKKQDNIIFDASSFSLWIGDDLQKHKDTFIDSSEEEIITNDHSKKNVRLTTVSRDYLEKHDFRILEKSEVIEELMAHDTYSTKCLPDMPEEDLLQLYLKMVHENIQTGSVPIHDKSQSNSTLIQAKTQPGAAQYVIFSDAGFGMPLRKHTFHPN